MRSHEVFARMSPEQAEAFLLELRQNAPDVARIAIGAASGAFKLRPQFLRKQPRAKQAEWMRKALARTAMNAAAEEVLAEYFLNHRSDLLVEWLDALGIEHDEGVLQGDPPDCPAQADLEPTVERFRSGDDPQARGLLLQAFAAQSAVDWPVLESLISA